MGVIRPPQPAKNLPRSRPLGAGVVPETRVLNGADPKAFVLSANIHRRHMTKGQRAMAVAKIYREPEKGGRGKKSKTTNLLVSGGFSRQRLDQSRTVLHHAPAPFRGAIIAKMN